MKIVATATVAEISNAIAAEVLKRPDLHGKFLASVEAIDDPSEKDPTRRFRIECVFFDTQEGARQYLAPPKKEPAK